MAISITNNNPDNITPIIEVTPYSQACLVFEQFWNGASEKFSSLTSSVTDIGASVYAVATDDGWVSLFNETINVTSQICTLLDFTYYDVIPGLSLINISYLGPALKNCVERLQFLVMAVKTSQFADAFFLAGRSVGAVGSILSDTIKPFSGGLLMFSLMHIPAVSLTFSFIFPIILIVLSGIGGTTQGWSLMRSICAKSRLENRMRHLDGSLQSLNHVLPYFQKRGDSVEATLKEKMITENFFANSERAEYVQKRIEKLMGFDADPSIKKAHSALEQLLPIMEEAIELPDENTSIFERIDSTVTLMEKVLKIARDLEIEGSAFSDLENGLQELSELKKVLYAEGVSIAENILLEAECRVMEQTFQVLTSAMTLISSILYLAFPQFQLYAHALSLTSSSVGMVSTIINKAHIRYDDFRETERFFHLLEEQKKGGI